MVSFTKLLTAGLVATSAIAAPCKLSRGAAYNDVTTVSALTSGGSVSWAYNWAGSLSGLLPQNVEFVPMLWGPKMFGGWVTAIETALSSGSSYILGFNEPDMPSQANMSPSDAANYYMTYITPVVRPGQADFACSGFGLDWFESFIGSCSGCGISGLAVHWYGNDADNFKSFVTKALDTAAKHSLSEVWITEFALNADINGSIDPANTAAFLSEVIPWLDSQPGVTRYSYFMCAENYLLTGNTLNQAGQAYVSA
ncbi:Glycoside hydrolase superfamily [Penicillium cf. griseofulvum]|nr:Glycoside hydrolase superfamily [Penicillium cf. griseofulvum]